MSDRSNPPTDEGAAPRGRSDRGVTLVEVVLTLALLGTGVVAVVGGLQTTIAAGRVDKVAAADASMTAGLFTAVASAIEANYQACDEIIVPPDTPPEEYLSAVVYQGVAEGVAEAQGWPVSSIDVDSVRFLGRSDPSADLGWGSTCLAAAGLFGQQVSLLVTAPSGSVQRMELVVHG